MFPYRNRLRWLLFGRYSHLVRAVHDRRRTLQDTILEQRVTSLQAWNTVRFGISIFLSIGVLATLLSTVAKLVPGGIDDSFILGAIGFTSAATGGLTLVYLFLTRLLGQLEIDILAILTLDHSK